MCVFTWDELLCRSAGLRMLEAASEPPARAPKPACLTLLDRRAAVPSQRAAKPAAAAAPTAAAKAEAPIVAFCPKPPPGLELSCGKQVPQKLPAAPKQQPVTSLKVSNVPFRYSQAEVFEELGLHGKVDFFHLHGSMYLGHHVGVAIVNFLTEAHALSFQQRWQGRRMALVGSKKPLKVVPAPQQGRFACLREVQEGTPLLPIVRLGDNYLDKKAVVHMMALAKDGVAILRL